MKAGERSRIGKMRVGIDEVLGFEQLGRVRVSYVGGGTGGLRLCWMRA